jgi:hypothetical protein
MFMCDWCGEEIENSRGRGTMKIEGYFADDGLFAIPINDSRRHYHIGLADDAIEGDSCMLKALSLVDSHIPRESPRQKRAEARKATLTDTELVKVEETAWDETPRDGKLHLVLNALGDERMRLGPLRRRLQEKHPIFEPELRRLLARMIERGDVVRVKDKMHGSQQWHAYERARVLGPELKAFEQQFPADGVL